MSQNLFTCCVKDLVDYTVTMNMAFQRFWRHRQRSLSHLPVVILFAF